MTQFPYGDTRSWKSDKRVTFFQHSLRFQAKDTHMHKLEDRRNIANQYLTPLYQ